MSHEAFSRDKLTSMFGAFNLREGSDLETFKSAFDAFCGHLKGQGHVLSWRLWERAYHDGYDSGFPDVGVILEMCFPDHQASLNAWEYIEGGSEPMKSLHYTMIRQTRDSRFVLCHER